MSDWDDSEDSAWIVTQRAVVAEYLARQGLHHGPIEDGPRWYISPYVAVWAVESLAAPGATGWWAISGDLPTDYASSKGCPNARAAVKHFADSWLDAARDPREDGTLGTSGLPAAFKDLLASRAKTLAEFYEDDEIWLLDDDDDAHNV